MKCSVVGLVCACLVTTATQAEFLVNGGAEEGPLSTGWITDSPGTIARVPVQSQSHPSVYPFEGEQFWSLARNPDSAASMWQTGASGVDVPRLRLSGHVYTEDLSGENDDYGLATLSFLDSGGNVLSSSSTDQLTSEAWMPFAVELDAPNDAVSWTVTLAGVLERGSYVNVFYDAVSLSVYTPADFDRDGDVDLVDVNLLTAEANLAVGLAVPPADTKFDLNGDDTVNTADLDQWLADAATINGLDSPYLRGDANLDGDVDVWDFDGSGDAQILSSNMGMASGAQWGDGDFNGDGDVDVWDFDGSGDAQVLSSNLGTAHDVGAAPVPEPSTVALLAMGVIGLLAYAWRRRTAA